MHGNVDNFQKQMCLLCCEGRKDEGLEIKVEDQLQGLAIEFLDD